VGWNRLAQSLRTLAWLVTILAGAQIFMAGIQGALDGLLLSTVGLAMAKLATLVLLAELVTITTPLQALLTAIEPLLRPLNLLGLSSERLSLSIGLLIRLATLQRSNWAQLNQAYQVRGVTKPGLKLLAPSLRAGLRQTDHMAQALNARLAAEESAHSQSPRPRE
jgi:biotin transport system permease protein